MNITNGTKGTPLGVGAKLIEPGQTEWVAEWDQIKDNPIYQAWVKRGMLIVHDSRPEPTIAAAQVADDQTAEKDRLIAILADRDVTKDRRSSLDTLRRLVDEAEAEE